GLRLGLKLRDDALSQHLAEFDSPLVKRINVPDDALSEDGVFVKGNEFAESLRCESLGQNRVRWPVAFEDSMRHEPIRRAFFLHLLGRLTEGKRLRLREHVCQEHVVMRANRIERFGESDEIAWDESRSLVNQLVERMLPIRSRLAPIDGAGLVCHFGSVERNVLAVALHRQLLQIWGEPLQVLFVRKDGDSLCAKEFVVPDRE